MPRVLVAEPSAPISAALRKFLDGTAEVVLTHYLDEAVQSVRARAPEVLIASVSGTFDGEVLCVQVHKQSPETAVVLIYPPDEEQPQDRALATGADAFLVSPLKKSAVLNTLRVVLQIRAARQHALELEVELGRANAERARAKDELSKAREELAKVKGELAKVNGELAKVKGELAQAKAAAAVAKPAAKKATGGENTADEAFFKKYLLLEIKRSKRYQYPVALLLIELDGLTQKLASEASPEFQSAAVRSEVFKALGALLRDIDLAVPFAEGRFLVFLPHTPRAGCGIVAERIAKRLSKLDHFQGTASIGVASYDPKHTPNAAVSFGALVKDARTALKKAQEAGGGAVEIAVPSAPVKRNRISMG